MSQEARSSSDRTHSHRNITTTLKELRRNESFWKVAKLASAAGVSIAVVIMAKRLLNQGRHDELEHFLGQAGISGSLVEQLEHIEYINVPDIEKSVREYLKTHAYWATPARATPAIWQSTMELMQARWQEPLLSARHLKTERGFNPDSFRFPEGIFAILQYDQVQAYVSLVGIEHIDITTHNVSKFTINHIAHRLVTQPDDHADYDLVFTSVTKQKEASFDAAFAALLTGAIDIASAWNTSQVLAPALSPQARKSRSYAEAWLAVEKNEVPSDSWRRILNLVAAFGGGRDLQAVSNPFIELGDKEIPAGWMLLYSKDGRSPYAREDTGPSLLIDSLL